MDNDTTLSALLFAEDSVVTVTRRENLAAIGLIGALSACGLVGNVVVLYVFARKNDRLVSTTFIIALAVVDLFASVLLMPFAAYMQHRRFVTDHDSVCKLYFLLTTTNTPFSAFIMVAIAFDRYFNICHPFVRVITLPRAKVVVVCAALASLLLGVFTALEHGVVRLEHASADYASHRYIIANASSTAADVTAPSDSDVTESYWLPAETTADDAWARNTSVMPYKQCVPINPTSTFLWVHHKLYIAINGLCLLHVIVLYSLIYKSVITRRFRRQRQKRATSSLVNEMMNRSANEDYSVVTSTSGENARASNLKAQSKLDKERRIMEKKEQILIANLKTAAILLIVTLVFIITHLPSVLMTLHLIRYNVVLWYIYFANNVANPIIYSFMNNNFRKDLRKHTCADKRPVYKHRSSRKGTTEL